MDIWGGFNKKKCERWRKPFSTLDDGHKITLIFRLRKKQWRGVVVAERWKETNATVISPGTMVGFRAFLSRGKMKPWLSSSSSSDLTFSGKWMVSTFISSYSSSVFFCCCSHRSGLLSLVVSPSILSRLSWKHHNLVTQVSGSSFNQFKLCQSTAGHSRVHTHWETERRWRGRTAASEWEGTSLFFITHLANNKTRVIFSLSSAAIVKVFMSKASPDGHRKNQEPP